MKNPLDPAELMTATDKVHSAGMPGVFAEVRDGDQVWRGAAGVADVTTGRPIRGTGRSPRRVSPPDYGLPRRPEYALQDFAAQLGLPNPFGGLGFPRIPYTLSAPDSPSYDASYNTNTQYLTYAIFDQDFTKIKGRHQFLFGGRIRYEFMRCLEDQQTPYPQVSYNATVNTGLLDPTTIAAGTYSAMPYTGSVAGNFFMGIGTYSTNFRRSYFPLHNNEKSLYFQDNWKVNDRLTLNLGVRYEYNSPVAITDNSVAGFDPVTHKVILANTIDYLTKAHDTLPQIVQAYANIGVQYETAQQARLPSHLVYNNYWDFGPRIGAAYRVTTGHRPLVFRSGFAIFGFPGFC